MARLVARGAFEGVAMPAAEGVALTAVEPGAVTSVAPFRGGDEAVAGALGLGELPEPGLAVAAGGGRLAWWGEGRWLLLGAEVPDGVAARAAVVPQGDGVAWARLEGPLARDVLARLVPLDLREGAFPVGAVARTLLNHMAVTLWREGAEAWSILAMRSMAATVAREVGEAVAHVAARARTRP